MSEERKIIKRDQEQKARGKKRNQAEQQAEEQLSLAKRTRGPSARNRALSNFKTPDDKPEQLRADIRVGCHLAYLCQSLGVFILATFPTYEAHDLNLMFPSASACFIALSEPILPYEYVKPRSCCSNLS